MRDRETSKRLGLNLSRKKKEHFVSLRERTEVSGLEGTQGKRICSRRELEWETRGFGTETRKTTVGDNCGVRNKRRTERRSSERLNKKHRNRSLQF